MKTSGVETQIQSLIASGKDFADIVVELIQSYGYSMSDSLDLVSQHISPPPDIPTTNFHPQEYGDPVSYGKLVAAEHLRNLRRAEGGTADSGYLGFSDPAGYVLACQGLNYSPERIISELVKHFGYSMSDAVELVGRFMPVSAPPANGEWDMAPVYSRKGVKCASSYASEGRVPAPGTPVWFLLGMIDAAPMQGTIRNTTDIDNMGPANTYANIVAEDGSEYHLSLSWVYDHKPKLVTVTDEYGETRIWASTRQAMAMLGTVEEYLADRGSYPEVFQAVASVSSSIVATDIWNLEFDLDAVSPMGLSLLIGALMKIDGSTLGLDDVITLAEQRQGIAASMKAADSGTKPWELTEIEWNGLSYDEKQAYTSEYLEPGWYAGATNTHQQLIIEALKKGITIPDRVLADYPSTAQSYGEGGSHYDNPWKTADKYHKLPVEVDVEFATEPGQIETLEGIMDYDEGDALVTGVEGERYPVKLDIFEQTFEKVKDGRYRIRSGVDRRVARRVESWWIVRAQDHDFVVRARSGEHACRLAGLDSVPKGPYPAVTAARDAARQDPVPVIIASRRKTAVQYAPLQDYLPLGTEDEARQLVDSFEQYPSATSRSPWADWPEYRIVEDPSGKFVIHELVHDTTFA